MSEYLLRDRYFLLLRKYLTRSFPEPVYAEIPPNNRTMAKKLRYQAYSIIQNILKPINLCLVQTNRATGETMMGMGAMDNLDASMRIVLADGIPGDFVETGVWRGGRNNLHASFFRGIWHKKPFYLGM